MNTIGKVMYEPEGAYFYEDYKHLITDTCTMCGRKIPATWDNYYARGNFCMACTGLISRKPFYKKSSPSPCKG